MSLTKDHYYYIEADMLEGSGDDHLSVGVKLPNGKSLLPIPNDMLRLRMYNFFVVLPKGGPNKKFILELRV